MLVPIMQAWVPQVCAALTATPAASPATWGIQAAALRLAHQLVTFFSKPLAAAMPPLVAATWQLMLVLQVWEPGGMAWGGVWSSST